VQANGYAVCDDVADLVDRMEQLREDKPDVEEPMDRRDTHVIALHTSLANAEAENRLLKEQRMCKICMDSEVSIVFLPCGHLVSCPKCAPALLSCPICRVAIRGSVRTYLS
jgi:hypothetical protein